MSVFSKEQQRWILEGHAVSVMHQLSLAREIPIRDAKLAVEAWLEGYVAATQTVLDMYAPADTLTFQIGNTGD